MAEVARAFVTLIPSMKGAQAAIGQELGPASDKAGRESGKKLGGGMLAGAKSFLAPMAAAFAGAAAVSFLGDAISEAREAAKVGRLTNAVIKSTAGVANISAVQVGNLAEALSNKAGVDDEVVQSGANMLLTFTKVRNEVGAGNDIFNRATAAALNVSAALGTDMKGASLLVGKALNDPVKGVTALTRSGVQFTDAQKEQIKAMVESGDTMGAQKLILSELTTQFGGAAAAAADPAEKAKVAWGNFKEDIGTAVLPILDKLLTWFTEDALPAIQKFGGFLSRNSETIKLVAQVISAVLIPALIVWGIRSLISGAQAAAGWLLAQAGAVKAAVVHTVTFARIVAGWVATAAVALASGARAAGAWLLTQAGAARAVLVHIASVARIIAGWILMGVQSLIAAGRMAVAWLIAMGPVGIIIAIVIALVALIILNWDKIKKFTVAAFSFIVNWIKKNWKLLISIVLGPIGIIIALVVTHWDKIKAVTKAAFSFVLAVVKFYINLVIAQVRFIIRVATIIKDAFVRGYNAAKTWLTNLFNIVKALPGRLIRGLGNLGRLLFNKGKDLIRGFINGIQNMATALKNAIVSILPGPLKKFAGKLGLASPSKLFREFGQDTIQGFVLGLEDKAPKVTAPLEQVADALSGHAAGFTSPRLGGLVTSTARGDTEVRVFIGDRELTDIIRIEQHQRDKGLKRRAAAGSGAAL